MSRKYENLTTEELVLDERFFSLVDSCTSLDDVRMQALLSSCSPDKAQEIRDAYLIIKGTKVVANEIPDRQIEVSLERLYRDSARRKARRRRLSRRLAAATAAAACVAVIVAGVLFSEERGSAGTQSLMLAELEHFTADTDSVKVKVGDMPAVAIANNAILSHNRSAQLVVNDGPTVADLGDRTQHIHIEVPYGRRSAATLPDGTQVWLNAGSKLIYPSRFEQGDRDVYLSGEAYFEVARDLKRRFIVHTREMEVAVLGTSFNLSAYSTDGYADVVLASGSVSVRPADMAPVVLIPGQRLRYRDGNATTDMVDVSYHTAWKDGYISLDSDPLNDVLKRLERYYNVEIEYDEGWDSISYHGKFDLPATIVEALDNVAMTSRIIYRQTGERKFAIGFGKGNTPDPDDRN